MTNYIPHAVGHFDEMMRGRNDGETYWADQFEKFLSFAIEDLNFGGARDRQGVNRSIELNAWERHLLNNNDSAKRYCHAFDVCVWSDSDFTYSDYCIAD